MGKKKKFSKSFVIGIFVLAGLAMLVGFILWMGATQFFKDYNYYVTYFEDSVGGLENGSAVKYLGVSCGLVQSVGIAPDGKLVEIILKLDKSLVVSDSLIVKLEMAGLAGGKYLQLYSTKNSVVNNISLSFKPPYPLLNSAPSQLDEITQSAESIVADLKQIQWHKITNELGGTLEGTNKMMNNRDLALIFTNLREITQNLNALISNLSHDELGDNLKTTSASLLNIATQLEKFSVNLNTKLDEVNVAEYLDKYYLGFESTVKTTNSAINKIQSSMIGVNSLIEDIEKTNKVLQKTLRNINESPYLFLTEPPPKENITVKTPK